MIRAWPLVLLAACMLPADAQDAVRVQPGSYKIRLDNDRVRVLEYTARPGMAVCGIGVHSHPAHLTIMLTPQKVRVRQPGSPFREFSAEEGAVLWSGPETHEVENISRRDVRVLLVEVKGAGGPAEAAAALR